MRWLIVVAVLIPGAGYGGGESDDPYLWLEDVNADEALNWVRERNATSVEALAGDPSFEDLEARLLGAFDSDDRIPYVTRRGDGYYNFWRDGEHARGVWRRTTLEEYRKDAPKWDVVLDLDALAESEEEPWVWGGSRCLPPEYMRCLIALSRGGADATVTREFDVETRSFVADGFAIPEAKGDLEWIDLDTVLVGTDFGEGSLTDSGYPRVVKRWRRGTPLDDAEIVYEGETTDVWVGASHSHSPGFERTFVYRGLTFYTSTVFVERQGELVPIPKQEDADVSVHREWIYFSLRSDWDLDGVTYVSGSLLVAPFERWMKGKRKIEVLFEPGERTSLVGFTPTRDHVVLNILDNVRNTLQVRTPGKKGWSVGSLPGLPVFGTLGLWAEDDDHSNVYFLTVSDYVTPSSLARGEVGQGAAETLKTLPEFFDTTGLVITQHAATSADGTRVPYFQVAPEDLALDGSGMTLLYGYGGFEISLLPSYRYGAGIAWLEKGGVYVVANIRGGGEFGPRWHQAALKENRHRAYEDFIAVGEDLIERGVTSTPRLGIAGGSNGGLLMGNMYTMRPDLWGAILCKVPLLDMQRYHMLLAGASWMGEYGNPDVPEEWAYIRTFSPYHNIDPDVSYPPMLITTSTRDDRVHPGHARKMAARLVEYGKDISYYENIEGGHGGAANNAQRAFMGALGYSFLWQALSPSDPLDESETSEEP